MTLDDTIEQVTDKLLGRVYSEQHRALADFLDIPREDIEPTYDDEDCESFTVGSGRDWQEYMVLSEDEADQRAGEYIKETLWAFNAHYLADWCDLDEVVFTALAEQCEGSNEAVEKLIGKCGPRGSYQDNINAFIEDAIDADGRGHFMSTYDGEEHEQGDWLIYRVN